MVADANRTDFERRRAPPVGRCGPARARDESPSGSRRLGTEVLDLAVQFRVVVLLRGDGHQPHELVSHKVEGVRERIEAASAQLWYLPPYSPDLNPIELWFSKLKALRRTVRRRTVEELWDTVGACLSLFSATECRNYFRHCGYAATTQS
jgi:transposase